MADASSGRIDRSSSPGRSRHRPATLRRLDGLGREDQIATTDKIILSDDQKLTIGMTSSFAFRAREMQSSAFHRPGTAPLNNRVLVGKGMDCASGG